MTSLLANALRPLTSGERRFLPGEEGFDDATALIQHLVDLLRLFPACFREIRPPASSAADERRNLLHDLPGFDATGQIRRDGNDDLHLAVARRREDDDAALDLGLE